MSLLGDLKEIDIISWLGSKGYKPEKESESKAWYCSPFRQENQPSFVVYKGENTFKDFGAGTQKGDIIDLVKAMESCDTKTAMSILSENLDTKRYEPIEVNKEPLLTVTKVLEQYTDPRLIMYLRSRNIPKSIYSEYTKECHYQFRDTPEKSYSGIGWKNNSGGYELRSAIHKYCTAPKDITTLNEGEATLNLFEGFINFFSALVYFGVDRLVGTTIVLNGLGMNYKVLPDITKYQKVNCYLDHGTGGNVATDMIRARVGADRCFDHRYLYEQHEDFNDVICRNN